ncbi:MAG: pseudouridine synthase [Verrucomicrobiota bacterium]
MSELPILYRDDHYIVINKPPGMLVHRTDIDKHETIFAVQTLRDQIGQNVYPVHRLDKPTSGCLIFALNSDSLAALKAKFESREISKTYQAIVRGYAPDSGEIDHPLRKLLDGKGPNKSDETQDAQTTFKTLARSEIPLPTGRFPTTRYSLVELLPKTGRRHQLRRHMVHINHPIIGDTRHGDNTQNKLFRERYGHLRLWLSATRIQFEHPITQATIIIKAPLWPDFQKAQK